jgi:hypothetical protein
MAERAIVSLVAPLPSAIDPTGHLPKTARASPVRAQRARWRE